MNMTRNMISSKRGKSGSRARSKSTTHKHTHNHHGPTTDPTFRKYEVMLKVGADMNTIILAMQKDNLPTHLIHQFTSSHGSPFVKRTSVMSMCHHQTHSKFDKYNRMKKLNMPIESILTQMRMDGISQSEIDIFLQSGISQISQFEAIKIENDPIKIVEQLPKKPIIPRPNQQMKMIHWEPIKLDQVKGSIWGMINQEWMDYDINKFELKFQVRKNKPKINHHELKHGVIAEMNYDQNDKVTFVDPKRSQQVQIGLKSFHHMTNEQLRSAILTLDELHLDVNKVSSLMEIAPSCDEQLKAEKMSEIKDVKYFGIVERFFYSLCDIVELKERLETWYFKLVFEDKARKIEEDFTIIETAKIIVMRSDNLKEIFGILLAFGNHMNYGNKRKGNAYGFHLPDLALLPQIKTFDGSMTFPMYLYSFIKKNRPQLLRIIKEFSIVSQAAIISGDSIEKEYNALNRKIKALSAMINRYKEEYIQTLPNDDTFIESMSAFEAVAKKKLWKLKFAYDAYHKSEKQLIQFFAYNIEEDEKVTIQRIYTDLSNLVTMLESSKKKLKSLNEQQKKRERDRKPKQKKRGKTETFHRDKFEKFAKLKQTSQKYAIAIDDMGTPVAHHAMKHVTFENTESHIDQHINKEAKTGKIDKFRKSARSMLSKRRRAESYEQPPILDDNCTSSPSICISDDDNCELPASLYPIPAATKSSDQIITAKYPKQNRSRNVSSELTISLKAAPANHPIHGHGMVYLDAIPKDQQMGKRNSCPPSPRDMMKKRNLKKAGSLKKLFSRRKKKRSKTSGDLGKTKTKTKRGSSITFLTPSTSALSPVVAECEVELDQFPDNMSMEKKANMQYQNNYDHGNQ